MWDAQTPDPGHSSRASLPKNNHPNTAAPFLAWGLLLGTVPATHTRNGPGHRNGSGHQSLADWQGVCV